MKKIAIIYPKDSEALFNEEAAETFGGASVQLFLINKELNNYSDFKVYSFISNYPKIEFSDIDNFNLVKTFKNKDFFLKKIFIFHKNLRKINPDLIIQRGLTLVSCFLAVYCQVYKIKYIFMFAHDRESKGRYQKNNKKCFLFNFLLKYTSLLVVQNQEQEKNLGLRFRSKIKTLDSGYEIKPIKIRSLQKTYVLWVSRLEPWKNPEMFIKLAQARPKLKFLMIAPLSKNSQLYGEKIYQKADKVDNLEMIKFVSFKEIDYYFRGAKVFVNTSDQEGFPNTFVQAGKNYTPILSLSINPNDFLTKYRSGFCCDGDFGLMVKNLDLLLENKELYQNLSSNIYNYVKNNHDIKGKVIELIQFL